MFVCLFVCFFRENSFDLSLNGRDFLVNDSVSLTGLGIVNGDLIYVVLNTQEEEGAQTSQTADCASSSNLPCLNNVGQQDHLAQHAGSVAEVITDLQFFVHGFPEKFQKMKNLKGVFCIFMCQLKCLTCTFLLL